MTISFNQVMLGGNLVSDPVLRHTNNGKPVCEVTIAINYRRWVDGVSHENTTFVDVVLWASNAERAAVHLRKGDGMVVAGHLRQETWERDGVPMSKLKVSAERMQMVRRANTQLDEVTEPETEPF